MGIHRVGHQIGPSKEVLITCGESRSGAEKKKGGELSGVPSGEGVVFAGIYHGNS